jgi:hypothetical protein
MLETENSSVDGKTNLAKDAIALFLVMSVSVALAIEPHLANFAQHGTLEYLADGDDLLYASIAKAPYLGENGLRDPFALPSERVPTLFTWLQFVPLAKLTKALGIPLILIGLVWRVCGGALLGLALYVLFRTVTSDTLRTVAWSMGCALVCLTDAGFLSARWLVQDFLWLKAVLFGSVVPNTPNGMAQYRVVTPLLNLPFFLLLLATLLRKNPRLLWALGFGAVLLTIEINMYFFYWTAAIVGMGVYFLCLAYLAWADPARRSTHIARMRLVAGVLLLGLMLGAPQIYRNAQTVSDPSFGPILDRLSRPTHVPHGDHARSLNLRNRWEWGALIAGALVARALGARTVGLLWCFFAAGFALKNSALVTGLEFENYHWLCVTGPMGEILLLSALAIRFGGGHGATRAILTCLWGFAVVLLVLAVVIRGYEALHAKESATLTRLLQEQRPLRGALAQLPVECSIAGPPESDAALLFTPAGKLFHTPYTNHTSLISEEEIDERHALNAWLLGWDRQEYTARCRPKSFHVIVLESEARKLDEIVQHRLEIFDKIAGGAAGALVTRFRVCALLLPTNAPKPTRAGPWTQAGASPQWTFWVVHRD